MTRWTAQGSLIGAAHRPAIMGIINVTPDSFSDGGRFVSLTALLDEAQRLVAEGADIIDIGGESTRPGAEIVPVEEEIRRIIPVLENLVGRVSVPISIDTSKPEVARLASQAGAAIINDITGLANPKMLDLIAATNLGVVVMHIQGNPRTMQVAPKYSRIIEEIYAYLATRIEAARLVGIDRARIAIDPGIGFGKTLAHNLALLRDLRSFEKLGCPILVGTSRKGFLGTITGRAVQDRTTASVASALGAAAHGAAIVRVHDVAATRDAFLVWEAQHGWN